MARTTSSGTCKLCGKVSSKGSMTNHLKTCVPQHEQDKGTKQPIYHLVIQAKYAPPYWLHVEMPGNAEMGDLDSFLRHIWLECCGHLSAFTLPQPKIPRGMAAMDMLRGFAAGFDPDLMPGEVDMSCKATKIFKNLEKPLRYEYDFGSTTELSIKVVGQRQGTASKLRLLARNNAPEWQCTECKEPATTFCPYCSYDSPAFFCKKHGKAHRCDNGGSDMLMPVVNSPRMGVCGYTGPAKDPT
jgi:hypothetical protein